MLVKTSSSRIISLASRATEVPEPIANPTFALLSAGASLVPSPVTATTSPLPCKSLTNFSLSVGRARYITLRFWATKLADSSSSRENSSPEIKAFSSIPSLHNPICLQISRAVVRVSPVTILTLMPAFLQSVIASATSGLIGSAIPT